MIENRKKIERKKLNNSKITINGMCNHQLMFSVFSSLKFNYKDMKIFCWTDSLDFLFWIHNIKKNSKQFIQIGGLKILKFWLQGSPFLQLSQEDWLSTKHFEKSNESHCLEELSSSGIDADTKNIFSFEKYNSFENLIRITSFVDQL